MENILVFIVVIVIFNLLRRIFGAGPGRREKQPSRQRQTISSRDTVPDRKIEQKVDDPVYFRAARKKDTFVDYTDHEHDDDQYSYYDQKEQPDPEPKELSRPETVASRGMQTSAVSSNLREILSRRDPLVAAFIFHEIIDPPPAMRNRRKTGFNRQR